MLLTIVSLAAFLITPCLHANAKGVVCETLKNGLRVVIIKDTLAPVLTTEINYIVGSNDCPDRFPGMAHAQEHMMFRGSPGLSAGQLAAITAAMGGMSNADTQQTVTQYFYTVPSEYAELPLRIEAIRMRSVLDSDELWQKERGAIEQEVARDLSNPMYVFYSKLLTRLFEGTPYAHDALGTRPSFEKTTGSMLKKFHNTWYAPNNAILVISGDCDSSKMLKTVRRLFESIPPKPVPPRPAIKLKPLKACTIRVDTDFPYSLSIVAYRLPGYHSSDYAAAEILADVLNSQRANIYKLVANGKALFAEFDADILPKAGIGFAIAGIPKESNPEKMVNTLKNIINKYLSEGIPNDLIEAAKRREVADSEFRKNSIEGLAAEWSRALAVEGRNSPDDDIEAIKKVSGEDVRRVAHKYLTNKTAIVGILTPRLSGKPAPLKGRESRESFSPVQAREVPLPDWAEKILSGKRPTITKAKPDVIIMRNGIRLIIQPENITRTVNVYGRVKNNPDLEQPKGKEKEADILDELFSYGTTDYNRLAFRKAVDDIGAYLKGGTSFYLKVLSDHFDRGMELLSQNLLHPALPGSAFEIVKQENIGELKGELRSPSYLFKRSLLSMLYPKGDPVLRQPTPKRVSLISLEDVKKYYKKVFRPDLTTMVIIGNVSPEKTKKIIKKYFGAWEGHGPKPPTDLPPVPVNKHGASLVPDTSRVQDKVILAETLGITRFHPDYYPLQLGVHVLSGGFYATRLYHELREKRGLVYTVEAFLHAHKTRSLFGIVYGCDPSNVSKARKLIVQNLRDLQTVPITQRELKQAKSLLINQIPLSQSSTDGIADTLLQLSLDGLPLDEPIRAAETYNKINVNDVKAAFNRWIRPEDLVQVTLGPKPE